MRFAILLITACATVAPMAPAPTKIDWAAIDAVFREARWRTDHCEEPNSAKCDALWLLRDDIAAILKAQRDAYEHEIKP